MSVIARPGARAFHLTHRDRLAAIMRNGLRTDSPRLLTDFPSDHEVCAMYGCIPVFVSTRPWVEREHYPLLHNYGEPADFVLLSVDIGGLPLAADIMSLSGKGAYLEEDGLWFEENDHPLSRWVGAVSGMISYRGLVSDPELIRAANDWTQTAAVLSSIEPGRISIAD